MAFDWKSELRRPASAVLLALAVIGWFLAISYMSTLHSVRERTGAQLAQNAADVEQLKATLEQQQKAVGTLADLQNKAADADQERDAAAAKLVDLQKMVVM